MVIILMMIGFLLQESKYLNENELHAIKKGVTYKVTHSKFSYRLTYDIWNNRFVLFNKEENKQFKQVDESLNYLRKIYKPKKIIIEKIEKNRKETGIVLFDWVDNYFFRETKREISFEN